MLAPPALPSTAPAPAETPARSRQGDLFSPLGKEVSDH
jgi:hypothetical protein